MKRGVDVSPQTQSPANPTAHRASSTKRACFDEQARIASAWVLGDLVTLFSQLGLKDISRIAGK